MWPSSSLLTAPAGWGTWIDSISRPKLPKWVWSKNTPASLIIAADFTGEIPNDWIDNPTQGSLYTHDRLIALKIEQKNRFFGNFISLEEILFLRTQAQDLPPASINSSYIAHLHDVRERSLSLMASSTPPPHNMIESSQRFEDPGHHLFLGKNVKIGPGCFFDSQDGPIFIEDETEIKPFSFLEGPLRIGAHSIVKNARIYGPSIIGKHCRVSGEVANTIINNYTNKSHEGFMGHAYIGSWVNLGAGTTSSNMKLNYNNIDINIYKTKISTEKQKAGPLIGDYTKTGINTRLSPGSILGIGSMLTADGGSINGTVPPFTWIKNGITQDYNAFIKTTKKMMLRRGIVMNENDIIRLDSLYQFLT